MTRSVVDYEHLMDTSFSDKNISVKSGVRPRWERKQLQLKQQEQKQLKQKHSSSKQQHHSTRGGSSNDRRAPSPRHRTINFSRVLQVVAAAAEKVVTGLFQTVL